MVEHQPRSISKTLKEQNTRLTKLEVHLSSIKTTLIDLANYFMQIETDWSDHRSYKIHISRLVM